MRCFNDPMPQGYALSIYFQENIRQLNQINQDSAILEILSQAGKVGQLLSWNPTLESFLPSMVQHSFGDLS